jgi:hypothetical protein
MSDYRVTEYCELLKVHCGQKKDGICHIPSCRDAQKPDSTTAGPSGRAVVGCPPHRQPTLGTTRFTAWPIGCPQALNHNPCGACDLCEIMEQDRYIALLAAEAAIYL